MNTGHTLDHAESYSVRTTRSVIPIIHLPLNYSEISWLITENDFV